jgi:hypothetical protein
MIHCLFQSAISPLHPSRRDRWEGIEEVTVLSAIRDRFSAFSPSESGRDGSAGAAGDGDGLPFAGDDRLDDKRVVEGLSRPKRSRRSPGEER